MTNENTYIEYIEELVAKEGDIALNPKWVMKMLLDIRDANQSGKIINPDFLRASKEIWFAGQPKPENDGCIEND